MLQGVTLPKKQVHFAIQNALKAVVAAIALKWHETAA